MNAILHAARDYFIPDSETIWKRANELAVGDVLVDDTRGDREVILVHREGSTMCVMTRRDDLTYYGRWGSKVWIAVRRTV